MRKKTRSPDKKEIDPVDVLNAKHEKTSWGAIAKALGLNKGLLSAVARGKRRAPNSLIARLNTAYGLRIHLNKIPAQPCPACGAVPLSKRCPTCHPRKITFEEQLAKSEAWARSHTAEIQSIVAWATTQERITP